MSTKIYNGFRFRTPDGSPADPFEVCAAVAEALQPRLAALYRTKVAALATSIIDGCPDTDIDTSDRDLMPVLEAEMAMLAAAKEIRATQRRNPAWDFSCEVAFTPDRTDRSALLIRLFCEQPLHDALAAVPGVSEFVYFDNVDRPRRCTEEEWVHRCDVWAAAMNASGALSPCLVWTADDVVLSGCLGDRDALVAAVPTREQRARHLVKYNVVRSVAAVPDESTSDTIDRVLDAVSAAEADTEQLARVAEGLAEITVEHLFGARRAT